MIRQINTRDYPRLLEIWESAVLATHNFLKEEDFTYYKENLPNYFSFVSLWGYEKEGRLVGFIGLAENSLEMLFIDATIRGKGIGKKLTEFAIQEQGVTQVEVNEQNDQAVGFYQHIGFKIVNRNELDSQGKSYPILQMSL
ncbi:GNAT family N-acetyltransferase [Myroides sp. 1354]|uniref:GNAT family N-acetyltransferase n=1 Tax=unclassified Myroides TaxID=2642485 RepID=UPI002576ABEE|nr:MULTISPECIES: GNAT family N-acetyltransferase [unclassified Myroides]MDM1044638.1 GNAT family N-acetyltransferase [Myroides sp. R163-1]MDM1055351.1 GNAT family N-acetyltransferase [Myroides sp. 1354]MDM1068648.1 GNAT family N-acetyltransferase [Myroides sp. 1372]